MSALYTSFKEACLSNTNAPHGSIDLASDLIKCAIVADEDYTFSAAHQDYNDTGYSINVSYDGKTNQTLSNVDTTDGVFDNTANLTFSSVSIDGTSDIDALIHYHDSTVITTSPLICYHDGFSPITPNGSDITVAYNASGILSI